MIAPSSVKVVRTNAGPLAHQVGPAYRQAAKGVKVISEPSPTQMSNAAPHATNQNEFVIFPIGRGVGRANRDIVATPVPRLRFCSPAEKVHGLGSVCCRQRQIARRNPTGRRQITKLAVFLDLAEVAQTLSEPDPDRISEELRELRLLDYCRDALARLSAAN